MYKQYLNLFFCETISEISPQSVAPPFLMCQPHFYKLMQLLLTVHGSNIMPHHNISFFFFFFFTNTKRAFKKNGILGFKFRIILTKHDLRLIHFFLVYQYT